MSSCLWRVFSESETQEDTDQSLIQTGHHTVADSKVNWLKSQNKFSRHHRNAWQDFSFYLKVFYKSSYIKKRIQMYIFDQMLLQKQALFSHSFGKRLCCTIISFKYLKGISVAPVHLWHLDSSAVKFLNNGALIGILAEPNPSGVYPNVKLSTNTFLNSCRLIFICIYGTLHVLKKFSQHSAN